MNRRTLLAAAASLPLLPRPAPAQAWPSRPIRIIVPFGAGGVADLTMRTVAQQLPARLGQPVVVENRPGAGGIPAAQAFLQAPPDGHTLMMATNGTAVSRALFRELPYDPLRDFAPVGLLGAFAIGVLVSPNGPAQDIGAVIARMRANPGRVNIGTITAGSTQNLSAELFKIRAGVQAEIVAFPQTPQLITALLRGDVDVAFEITGPIWGQIESGAVKCVAVTSATRAANLPNVPTLMEAGVPDYDVTSWNAVVARAGTPAEVVTRLNAEINAVLAMEEVRQALTRVGVEPRGSTPEALGQLLAADIARWTEVVTRAGIPRQ
ncbi:MAG: tripartite tricarboxylate transporter substrate binding protein [Acetobacteraceae bacterium]|nr:tripartite tricarboxylate transporter substrate binding protein [Acetobacteraceae bacterium]MDW8397316.1 tripartite tricarboxylate transporter substrate binding protein [Acetobacteraceae bacterium]